MGKHYPSCRYHPEKEPVIVVSAEHEEKLGDGWYESPADFGIETAPGLVADPVIAEKRKQFLAAQDKEPIKIVRKKSKPGASE